MMPLKARLNDSIARLGFAVFGGDRVRTDCRTDLSLRTRIVISALIGIVAGWFSMLGQLYLSKVPGGDFLWAMQAGRELLNGIDPYGRVPDPLIPYPLPAALVGVPFSFFEPSTGAGVFFGLSVALLSYGLLRDRYGRLLIFLAMPFWFALVWAQWSPLIMASAFIPALLPVVLIKLRLPCQSRLRTLTESGFTHAPPCCFSA